MFACAEATDTIKGPFMISNVLEGLGRYIMDLFKNENLYSRQATRLVCIINAHNAPLVMKVNRPVPHFTVLDDR